MKERIKKLDFCQKGILIFLIAMALVFTVIYSVTISRVGIEYQDTILVPGEENGSTVYSGKIKGQQAQFIVSEDKTIAFQYGDQSYGPYVAKEVPDAIPKDEEMQQYMTGVELWKGDTILFRGGVLKTEDSYWLYNEDGTLDNLTVSYMTGEGTENDLNGNTIIDSIEPSATTILELMDEPKLVHKGSWAAWLGAVFICALDAFSILFIEELFRWNLAFRIRNADGAEPSELEIAGRYISWIAWVIMALALFLMGLQ